MPTLNIRIPTPAEVEQGYVGAVPELFDRLVTHVKDGIIVTALPDGTVSQKPTVAIILPLEDGNYVLGELTLAMFLTAAGALKAKYGDPQ